VIVTCVDVDSPNSFLQSLYLKHVFNYPVSNQKPLVTTVPFSFALAAAT
jgi:hypothetical protein